MKSLLEIKQANGVMVQRTGIDGGCGKLYLNGTKSKPAIVVFSWGGGWEHVSVSYPNRCPTWEEMCRVKDIFWYDNECAVQFHPPKSDYINNHSYCLHLWHKRDGSGFELPPKEFV